MDLHLDVAARSQEGEGGASEGTGHPPLGMVLHVGEGVRPAPPDGAACRGGGQTPPRDDAACQGGGQTPLPHDAACITKKFATFSPFPRCYETFTRVARKSLIKFTGPEEIWTIFMAFSGGFRGVFRGW